MSKSSLPPIEPLDDDFPRWEMDMEMTLGALGLWAAVIGEETNASKIHQAKCLIGLNVADHHKRTVREAATAKAAWDALRAIYTTTTVARQDVLRRQLASLRMAKDESVTKLFSRARTIASGLSVSGAPVQDSEVLNNVLNALPKQFHTVATIIRNQSADTVNLEKIQQQLIVEEQQLTPRMDRDAERGMAARQQQHNTGQRQRFGGQIRSTGQRQQNSCQQPGQQSRPQCNFCGKIGHIYQECRTRIAQEQQQQLQPKQQIQQTPRHNQAERVYTALTSSAMATGNRTFIIDSGASKHISCAKDCMSNYRAIDHPTSVIFGDGVKLPAIGTGDIGLADHGILLKDVLHVPKAAAMLFSVSQATASGAEISFKGDFCTIRNRFGETLAKISNEDGLFQLTSDVDLSASAPVSVAMDCTHNALAANSMTSAQLLHRRLGHLNPRDMARLQHMSTNFSVSPAQLRELESSTGAGCMAGKQTRNVAFTPPAAHPEVRDKLSLVHTDLVGPMHVPSLGGSLYAMPLLDEKTNYAYISFIKHKSDAEEAFANGGRIQVQDSKSTVRSRRRIHE